MPRQVVCPSCGRVGAIPDGFAGGLVRCPQCKTVMQVPADERPASSPPSAKPRPAARAASRPMDEADEPVAAVPPPAAVRGRGPAETPMPGESPKGFPVGPVVGAGVGGAVLAFGLFFLLLRGGAEKKADDEKPVARDAGAAATTVKVAREPAVASDLDAGPAPGLGTRAKPAGLNSATSLASEVTTTGASAAFTPEAGPALIQRLKQATVFIKMRFGKGGAVGTGFVIKVDGDSALIATNRHVVDPHMDPGDDHGGRPGEQPRLSVVFRSGEGANEQEVATTVVAVDTDPRPDHDMAILSVKGVRSPPRPIDPTRVASPGEGMDLRIYGFPFGFEMNVVGRGNPSITINKGSLAALRRDDYGRVSLLQIDGSVNPGNSGGPILDEQGRLLGITTLKNARADNIGYAIPAANLQKFLAGGVGDVEVSVDAVRSANAIDVRFKAKLADPMGKVKSVWANIADAPPDYKPAVQVRPDSNGDLPPMPNASPILLKIDRTTGIASGLLPFSHDSTTPAGPNGQRVVRVQISYANGDGKTIFKAPVVYRVPKRPGNLVMRDDVRGVEDKLRRTMNKLGDLIDPLKDCAMERDGKGLSITIPGKLHILSPQIKDKARKGVKNAPMALADVDGDFLAHVKVTGAIRPGNEAAQDPLGKRVPYTIQGAGLLLWQDQDNYLRLERSCGSYGGNALVVTHRLILEVCKDGRDAGHAYIDVPDGDMQVVLQRKEGRLRCFFRPENSRNTIVFKDLAAEFPSKVQIGLSAFNTSKKPYTAKFDEFVLLDKSDKDRFDVELGQ